ncbi:MAG: thioredoxin [Clostridia bacterium]|nr:thioredoxin [Clostridia bacterium]
MSDIKNVLGKEEFNDIINSEVPVIVDFYATWCGPCKMQAPILHEFKDEVKEKAVIVKVDVDENAELASIYGVQSIPTIALFKKGELKEKTVGLTAKAQLSEMLIKHL